MKKINRFKAQPVFFKVQYLLKKIPFQPIMISRFFLLSLNAVPDKNYTRKVTQIRMATMDDIKGMCLLENKPHLFKTWLERGDFCAVAVDNDEIVGFEWFSVADCYHEERFNYKIIIPPDTVYAFDGYIKKSYRLRGIWIQFKLFLKQWMESNGRKKIIVLIDYGNDPSIKTHLRFGFYTFNDVHWVKIFGKSFIFEKVSLEN
jgi:GNAT superfamily N-acetyltransferase